MPVIPVVFRSLVQANGLDTGAWNVVFQFLGLGDGSVKGQARATPYDNTKITLFGDTRTFETYDTSQIIVTPATPPAPTGPGETYSGTVEYPDAWNIGGLGMRFKYAAVGLTTLCWEVTISGPSLSLAPLGTVPDVFFNGTQNVAYHVSRTSFLYEFGLDINQPTGNDMVNPNPGVQLEAEWDNTTETLAAGSPIMRTFTAQPTAIRVRAVNDYDMHSSWLTIKLPPVAAAQLVSDDGSVFLFDLTGTFDVDSPTWSVNLAGPGVGGLYSADFTTTSEAISNPTNVNSFIMVTDPDGLTDFVYVPITIQPVGKNSTVLSPTGALYAARALSLDTEIVKRPGVEDSPIVRGTIAGTMFPSLALDRTHQLYVVAKARADSKWRLYSAALDGRSFDIVSEVWSAAYGNATLDITFEGHFISVAQAGASLYFRRSIDGLTWGSIVDITSSAGTVASTRFKPVVWQREETGESEVAVSDCDQRVFLSSDYGRAWTFKTINAVPPDGSGSVWKNAHLSGLHDGGLVAVADCRNANPAIAGLWGFRMQRLANGSFTPATSARIAAASLPGLETSVARYCNIWQMNPLGELRFCTVNAQTFTAFSPDFGRTW